MSASLSTPADPGGYVPRRKRPSIWLLLPVLLLVVLSLLPLAYVGLKTWQAGWAEALHHEALYLSLKTRPSGKQEMKILPDASHNFKPVQSADDRGYEGPVVPSLFEAMEDFLKNKSRK